jgi:predicted Co/Zn/Cd cation transporter (cation efflux family)
MYIIETDNPLCFRFISRSNLAYCNFSLDSTVSLLKGDENVKSLMMKFKYRFGQVAPAAVDMSITGNRIILLAYYNLTLAVTALILEKGGQYMKKLSGRVIALLVLAMVAIAGSAYKLICLYRQVMGLNM